MNILQMERIVNKILDGTDIQSNIAISLDYPDKIITTIYRKKVGSQSKIDTLVDFDINEGEYTAKMQAAVAKFDNIAVDAVNELVDSVFGGKLLTGGIGKLM